LEELKGDQMKKVYTYVTEDNFINRQNYMYSQFGGADFLETYYESRQCFLGREYKEFKGHLTRKDLLFIKCRMEETCEFDEIKTLLNDYIKSFEVRKRVYSEYNEYWKPEKNASYKEIDLYMELAQCCIYAYRMTKCAKYLSCLLKIDDTLLSVANMMTEREMGRLAHIVSQEIREVSILAKDLEVEDVSWL
jgi:hypothetical protein